MSQILEAPILQSGVISASQGKEDWSQNYSAVNPKHLIEHWAHTWKYTHKKNETTKSDVNDSKTITSSFVHVGPE